MNKILIVGHPQSGYEEVEDLLKACGMTSAKPSRREGFLPQQISSTLCKVHNTGPVDSITVGEKIQQIEVGPLWHGMAMDLMLGNLEQPFWGWSDPQSIYLLDYWLKLDPTITFVLAYDKPQSVLTQIDMQSATELDLQTLQQRVQNWMAFNAELVHFFLRHPQRCLLVHTEQVRESAASYLQHMRARINAPWSERMEQLAGPLALSRGEVADSMSNGAGTPALMTPNHSSITPQQLPATDALAAFLADALLSQHPASLQLYEELQACANLPLGDELSRAMPSALDAWQSMVARQSEATGENELLLNQLHQVQEELERHYLDVQQKAHDLKALQKVEFNLRQTTGEQDQQLTEKQKQLAELQQQLSQLQTQLQTREQDAQKRLQALQTELESVRTKASEPPAELLQENELLLNQLHLVQEELERYYLESQQLKKKLPPPKPAEPVYYGAGQRIRQQLSYKLGATMIENTRSVGGWFSMPVELLRVARQHKRELPLRQAQKLPPIHKYRDAHEAERHRNHLSYRLGQTLLKNIRSPIGWMRLPMAIRREVRDFRHKQQQR